MVEPVLDSQARGHHLGGSPGGFKGCFLGFVPSLLVPAAVLLGFFCSFPPLLCGCFQVARAISVSSGLSPARLASGVWVP